MTENAWHRSMRGTRTWPYGTRKTVKVEHATRMAMLVSTPEEAFVLVGHGISENELPKIGDLIAIEFSQGGPTGGYWKVVET